MTVPCRLVSRAGKATLTTVLSMKAMLEPRIVAARIHRPAPAVHGAEAFADPITASSPGGFITSEYRLIYPRDSETDRRLRSSSARATRHGVPKRSGVYSSDF